MNQSATNYKLAAKVVTLDYEDLKNKKDLKAEIEEAYGKDGLGILVVKNVPKYVEYRKNLLSLAKQFGTLDEKTKAKYEDKKSHYSFGWSFGKEKFAGKFDTSKGSYYNNPQYDKPTEDKELIEKYPFYCAGNIWPKEEIPELEGAFKNLGQLIVSVGELVGYQCDQYVSSQIKSFEQEKISKTIHDSLTCKARLLYYFPKNEEVKKNENESFDDWCGWHLDHGTLTGLTKAIFQDENGNIIENKDKDAGLFIENRKNEIVKAGWAEDMLAFQIGESAQIHSGGLLTATPHCVRGSSVPGVSRSTFAVFMQPQWDASMAPPKEKTVEECNVKVLKEGMDFSLFTEKRLEEYY
eukprot:gene9325-1412_t